ncbi:hypothetical protein BJV78DRAFT_1287172 [Lactifluus subvellereus]|nr:hypothetical protein BJV78DRAFT_1287172 [Lactifluus subvellereus]
MSSSVSRDIVEALQCVKCAIRHDLLVWAPAPSSILEAEVGDHGDDDEDGDNDGDDNGEGSEAGEKGWDVLLIDDEDEEPVGNLGMDTDMD